MKKKICFIVNPNSGTGRYRNFEPELEQWLDLDRFDYKLHYTTGPNDAERIARESVKDCDAIIAVGGDGTVNEVARSLIDEETAMGIIPVGSGNGLARHLNIPIHLGRALETVNRYNIKQIDTARLNEHKFVNIAGIGFDALIGFEFAKGKTRGLWTYVKLTLKHYFRYRNIDIEMEVDGTTMLRKVFLISFANATQYGNNARIAPGAAIDDGLLTICILPDMSWWRVPVFVVRLFNGTLGKSSIAEFMDGRHIKIKQPLEMAQIDGEAFLCGKELEVEIHPASLNMIC